MGADLKAEVVEPAYEAARRFLIENPEAVRQDAELLGALGLRLDAANVLDFGPAALARVHAAHQAEASAREEIELIARENFTAQAQAQAAVIELIAADSAEDLANRLDEVAQARFGLVAGALAIEADDEAPAGWFRLVESQADMILGGAECDTRLGLVRTARGLFGSRAEAVESVALVRIRLGERFGVLAFGSGEAEGFTADMSDDLVRFLALVVEATAARWTTH
ncbi:DUF484 family protein [Phenylobacterium immobile]|uniref:DUF484 family protein n=1 Tax=Phenylobacterium immobile TaxID=21 RepID=UPI000B16B40A|nr:DUF484 family protein [Phenylobacterium immobile]